MANTFLLLGSASGAVAVISGALGAHALKANMDENLFSSYETAVQYQFWHALALLAVGILATQSQSSRILDACGWSFFTGSILFSGSLYLLTLTSLRQLGFINIGILTPIGGLCFIAGWLLLVVFALRS